MFDNLLELDHELLIYLNNLGADNWDDFWFLITNKLTYIPIYALLLYLMAKDLGKKGFLILIVTLAMMVTFTDQVTNLFKDGFERLRPCAQPGVVELLRLGDCSGYGFFSGHSSNTMAVAVFVIFILKSRFRTYIWLMIPWSVTVGYSRIYIGKHYPLDVMCGLAFGVVSGCLFYKLFKILKSRWLQIQ